MAMYGLGQQPQSQGYGQAPQMDYGNAPVQGSGAYDEYMKMNRSGGAGALNAALATWGGDWGSDILDPMDLFGGRAARAQNEQDAIARNSAMASLNAMGDQYSTTLDLQRPFMDLGIQGLGQMGQYTQGQNYDTQLNEGSRQLRGSANAAGLGNSSAAGRNMAGFVNNLTNEDMGRQYDQALRNIQIGQSAVGTMGQAAAGLGSGASAIYGNWGQNAGNNALGYGQDRQQSFSNAGQALQGAGQYFGSR